MEPYVIKYDVNQSSAKWLRWFYIIEGLLFISMFGLGYFENDLNWFHFVELLAGIIFLIIGIFFYKRILFNHSSAIFSEQGIQYSKKRSDEQTVNWSNINALKFSSDALILDLNDGTEQELKFPWLNYKERQEVKEHLKKYAEKFKLNYEYKY